MSESKDEKAKDDKKQIGLTKKGQEDLAKVMESGWFAEEQDAYRLAIAVALAADVAASQAELSGVGTKYNFGGGVDIDGKVRALIGIFAPDQVNVPGRYAERLAHAGLAILASKLGDDDALLADALSEAD